LNIFFRILLTVYAICLTIIAILVMIVALWPPFFDILTNNVYFAMEYPYTNFIMFIVALLFLTLSLIFLLSGIKQYKEKKAVTRVTNIGEIRISLETIENIALAVTRKIQGIKEIKAGSAKTEEKIRVELRVILLPEVNIPSLSEEIQKKVKHSVETATGIEVSNVSVIVENVYTGYRSRVE